MSCLTSGHCTKMAAEHFHAEALRAANEWFERNRATLKTHAEFATNRRTRQERETKLAALKCAANK